MCWGTGTPSGGCGPASGRADLLLFLPGSCLVTEKGLTPGAVLPAMDLRPVFSAASLAFVVFHICLFVKHITNLFFLPLPHLGKMYLFFLFQVSRVSS